MSTICWPVPFRSVIRFENWNTTAHPAGSLASTLLGNQLPVSELYDKHYRHPEGGTHKANS